MSEKIMSLLNYFLMKLFMSEWVYMWL